MITEAQLRQFPDSEIDCLRCGERMKEAGELAMFQGRTMVALTTPHTMEVVHFEARICPNCGKTEFFF